MDYDATNIPAAYDDARGYDPATLETWLTHIARHASATTTRRVLDLGCGTGRYSAALADRFEAAVLALDPSTRMLGQAKPKFRRGSVMGCYAAAEALPLADNTIDFVFLSMVFHHLADCRRACHEIRRVLRERGTVVVRNSTWDQAETFPYVGYFPNVDAAIHRLLPAAADVETAFGDAGLSLVAHEIIRHPMARDWPEFVRKSKRRADSILARLPDRDFEAGIAALESATSTAAPITVDLDLFVFRDSRHLPAGASKSL